jgi:hypothetical protein
MVFVLEENPTGSRIVQFSIRSPLLTTAFTSKSKPKMPQLPWKRNAVPPPVSTPESILNVPLAIRLGVLPVSDT